MIFLMVINVLKFLGGVSILVFILFGICYPVIFYNDWLINKHIEDRTKKSNQKFEKKEKELVGKRFFVERKDKRAVRCNLYLFEDDGIRPLIILLHGGDFLHGDSDEIDREAERLRIDMDCNVVSVSYSLIEMHLNTYSQEEIADVFEYCRTHAQELHCDQGKIVFCGIEAGGYLGILAGKIALEKYGFGPQGYFLLDPYVDYTQLSMCQARMHPQPVMLMRFGDLREMTEMEKLFAQTYQKNKVFRFMNRDNPDAMHMCDRYAEEMMRNDIYYIYKNYPRLTLADFMSDGFFLDEETKPIRQEALAEIKENIAFFTRSRK